jgi:hypothetical protein
MIKQETNSTGLSVKKPGSLLLLASFQRFKTRLVQWSVQPAAKLIAPHSQ